MDEEKQLLYGTSNKKFKHLDLIEGQPESLKVLIVDDDIWTIRILSKFTKGCGFNVLKTNDPAEGVAFAVKHKPTLIFLDIIMPDITGLQILKILKKIEVTSKIPVIIVSAHLNEKNLIESFRDGASAFITKPFTKAILYRKIEQSLGFAVFSYLGVDVAEVE